MCRKYLKSIRKSCLTARFSLKIWVKTMLFLVVFCCCCCSVAKSCLTLRDSMNYSTSGFPVFHYLPEFSQTLVHWVGDDIHLISVSHFSCPQSFPASGSFPVSQFFTSGGQSIGVSASTSVFQMNIQGLFPLQLTGLISLLFRELWRVFSNTTIQKHQFFGAPPTLSSNFHIHTRILEKP